MVPRARSAALIAATVLMGISWSFALVRIKTGVYPYLWAAALPLLAFYLSSGPRPFQLSRHVPAGMAALYTLVLWQTTRPLGIGGAVLTLLAGAAAAGALWLGAALYPPRDLTPVHPTPNPSPRGRGEPGEGGRSGAASAKGARRRSRSRARA